MDNTNRGAGTYTLKDVVNGLRGIEDKMGGAGGSSQLLLLMGGDCSALGSGAIQITNVTPAELKAAVTCDDWSEYEPRVPVLVMYVRNRGSNMLATLCYYQFCDENDYYYFSNSTPLEYAGIYVAEEDGSLYVRANIK